MTNWKSMPVKSTTLYIEDIHSLDYKPGILNVLSNTGKKVFKGNNLLLDLSIYYNDQKFDIIYLYPNADNTVLDPFFSNITKDNINPGVFLILNKIYYC